MLMERRGRHSHLLMDAGLPEQWKMVSPGKIGTFPNLQRL